MSFVRGMSETSGVVRTEDQCSDFVVKISMPSLVVMVGMRIVLLLRRHVRDMRVRVDHESGSVISGFASEKTNPKSSVCRHRPVSPDHDDDVVERAAWTKQNVIEEVA
jgi:hypothetical protein